MTPTERDLLCKVAAHLAELLAERDDYQHGPDLKNANALADLLHKVLNEAVRP